MSDETEGEIIPSGEADLSALAGMVGSLVDAAKGTEEIKADAQKQIAEMRFKYIQRDRDRESKWRDKMNTAIFRYIMVPWSLLFIGMFGWLLFKDRLDILGTIATHVVALVAGLLPGYAIGQKAKKPTQ